MTARRCSPPRTATSTRCATRPRPRARSRSATRSGRAPGTSARERSGLGAGGGLPPLGPSTGTGASSTPRSRHAFTPRWSGSRSRSRAPASTATTGSGDGRSSSSVTGRCSRCISRSRSTCQPIWLLALGHWRACARGSGLAFERQHASWLIALRDGRIVRLADLHRPRGGAGGGRPLASTSSTALPCTRRSRRASSTGPASLQLASTLMPGSELSRRDQPCHALQVRGAGAQPVELGGRSGTRREWRPCSGRTRARRSSRAPRMSRRR